MMILNKNIKEYCAERKTALKERIGNYGEKPRLAVIQVGNNPASTTYIKNKKKDCEEVGIQFEWYWYPSEISEIELITEIKDLQPYVDGLIVQLPLPPHIGVAAINEIIDKEKDVDGFVLSSPFYPCTPKGILDYLIDGCKYDFCGKNAVVIGRSEIVGKPLAQALVGLDATVTLCHSKTKNLWNHISSADIIFCAVGKEKFLNCYALHIPVVDIGINFDAEGKLVGDCYNTEGRDVTPVPGGVGLLTRVALLENVVKAYERQNVPAAKYEQVSIDGFFE